MSATSDAVLDFVLPGSWWRVPLQDGAKALDASIKGLAESVVGKHDDHAALRAQLRRQINATVDAARNLGGHQLHFATKFVGDLPLPATLTLAWPEMPIGLHGEADQKAALLRQSLPDSAATVVLPDARHAIVRTSEIRTSCYDGDGETFSVPHLDVAYWISPADTTRVALFAFTSPMVSLQAELVELFDAVVSTVRLREPM